VGQPAAKEGDEIKAMDNHIVLVPNAPPVLLPHPFKGKIASSLSGNVRILGKRAATVGSVAKNNSAHTPTSPGTKFQKPPANTGTIKVGSQTVRINGKAAARNGDIAETCNDPKDLPVGVVIASGKVRIG
jgi:uncharacterized Zn-binding protein involved in type VI secretion